MKTEPLRFRLYPSSKVHYVARHHKRKRMPLYPITQAWCGQEASYGGEFTDDACTCKVCRQLWLSYTEDRRMFEGE